jgi:hypothetical protein
LRIFISFASEQREPAELIAIALRGRGHQVFFSRDTLPPAESFDVRIERAVWASDFFIFLVSPEAVVKGKYTLTELSYARKKWPSASGHVLPVIVAPTPINSIPPFLRSVSIFEPEGNVAADTAAEVDNILRRSGRRSVWSFALFGAATGVLSFLSMRYFPILNAPLFVKVKFVDHIDVLPGLMFGALIAYLNWTFGVRAKFPLAIILLLTVVSWILAVNACLLVNVDLHKYTYTAGALLDDGADTGKADPQSDVEQTKIVENVPFVGALSGMIGGLVGAIGTLLGVALANDRARTAHGILPIVVAATLIGSILGLLDSATASDWRTVPVWLLLYVGWQGTFAGMLAQVLAPADLERP